MSWVLFSFLFYLWGKSWSVHGPTLSKWENLSLTAEPVGERHVYRLLSTMLGTGCHSVTGSYYHHKNKLFFFFGCAAQMWDFSSLARDWTHAPLHWKHGVWTTELNQRNFSVTDAAFTFFWEEEPVSGHSGCCSKYHRPGSLWTTEISFPQFWKLGSLQSRHQHGHVLVRARFLVHSSCLLPSASYGRRAREFCGVVLTKTLILFMKAPSTWSKHLAKPHILILSSLGARILT